MLILFIVLFSRFILTRSLEECKIDACEAVNLIKNEYVIENTQLIKLERRLRSLEQPGILQFAFDYRGSIRICFFFCSMDDIPIERQMV